MELVIEGRVPKIHDERCLKLAPTVVDVRDKVLHITDAPLIGSGCKILAFKQHGKQCQLLPKP